MMLSSGVSGRVFSKVMPVEAAGMDWNKGCAWILAPAQSAIYKTLRGKKYFGRCPIHRRLDWFYGVYPGRKVVFFMKKRALFPGGKRARRGS
jgi:hypothetical protein